MDLVNPCIFLGLLPLILPYGRISSEYHVDISVFFAGFRPHHLDILSWMRLEYPFLAHLYDQGRTIYHFMIKFTSLCQAMVSLGGFTPTRWGTKPTDLGSLSTSHFCVPVLSKPTILGFGVLLKLQISTLPLSE